MKGRPVVAAGLVAAAVLGTVLALEWPGRHGHLSYSGTVETREIQAGSKIGGRVTQVLVEEGQKVWPGASLVRFECDELQAQRRQAAAATIEARAELDRMLHGNRPDEIAEAEAAARSRQATLEKARNGPRSEEIAQARADSASASADATNANAYFERIAQLAVKDIVSRQQFDDARDRRDAARERAESARQRLVLLENGTRAEDLRAAEASYQQAAAAAALARKGFRAEDIEAARGRLEQAEGRVAELDARLREAELTAPADAVVEVVSVRPGDLVPAGRIVVTMLEWSQLWVRVYVPETELATIRVGQKAEIRVDGTGGRTFRGHVGQIASEAEFLPRNVQTKSDREHQVFGVKVYVENAEQVLKSGMSATVRLE